MYYRFLLKLSLNASQVPIELMCCRFLLNLSCKCCRMNVLQIPHETMHSNSLGLTVKIVEAVCPYAEKLGKSKELFVAATIDDRMRLINSYFAVGEGCA